MVLSTDGFSLTDITLSGIDDLLDIAAGGDQSAVRQLLERFRERLRTMVMLRMDQRLSSRIDPSDVVQDALAAAAEQLPEYLSQRPLPFYPWLRRLAWERLIWLHRRHVEAGKRSVKREVSWELALSDQSAVQLFNQLAVWSENPEARMQRQEETDRVRAMFDRLTTEQREVLQLRYLEQLTTKETAAVLGISEATVKMRQLRAIQGLQTMLGGSAAGEDE